jgi:CRP/FNR family nitrogen fixation transcriptional regulator
MRLELSAQIEGLHDGAASGALVSQARAAAVSPKALLLSDRQTVFHEGDEARRLYFLLDGAVMLYQILADGRRQVVDLIGFGEFFGLGAGPLHTCTAETLASCRIQTYDRGQAEMSPLLQNQLTRCMRATIARMHEHATLLGRKTALERVASFLSRLAPDCASRICPGAPAAGRHGNRIHLHLTRQEIAD